MTQRLLQMVISVILGVGIGATLTWNYLPIADNCKIVYVSQDELMELEQKRIKQDNLDKKQLFFGEVEKAVTLATQLPKTYHDRTTKVVYSMGAVSGNNVKSISNEIHEKIVKELKEQQKNSKNEK